MLRTAGAGTAKLILVCIDDPKAVNHAVKLIKSEFPWSSWWCAPTTAFMRWRW